MRISDWSSDVCSSDLRDIPRLQKRPEFLAAARAHKWAANGLVLQALQRGDDNGPRAGFTVTRKVGNAVIRNRARRRLKEAARSEERRVGKGCVRTCRCRWSTST